MNLLWQIILFVYLMGFFMLQGFDMEVEEEDDYFDIDSILNFMSEFDDNIMYMDEIFFIGQ